MDLKTASERMLEVFKEYEELAKQLSHLEWEYESRYAESVLKSGMGTALLKEAEAKTILNQEGFGERLAIMKADTRRLYYKWNVLQEYCRTLRAIMTRDSWQS